MFTNLFKKEQSPTSAQTVGTKADPTYAKMKAGEYELHVLIQTTVGLVSDGSSDAVDALICVEAFGKKEFTKVKKHTGYEEAFWGEHIYFNKEFSNNKQVEGARLNISVYDHNVIQRDSLIGNYELDIQRIYAEPNHVLEHRWLALSNTNRSFEDIRGYVKVSVSVIGEGDNSRELAAEPVESIGKDRKVLLPPNIQRKSYELTARLYKAKNLKPADGGKSVDAFVTLQFGSYFQRTDPVMSNLNPEYNMQLTIPVGLPAISQNVAIRVVDFNTIMKNEILGSFYININEVFNKKYDKPTWINIYGPQLNANNTQQFKIYSVYPDLATYYCGSILMSLSIRASDNPKKQMKAFFESLPPPIMKYFRVRAEVHSAVNLFEREKRYKVCIRMGDKLTETAPLQAKSGFVSWTIQKNLVIQTFSNQELPDLFIYLVDQSDKKVCYLRFQPVLGQKVPLKFRPLLPDLSVVQIQPEEAGQLKIGFQVTQLVNNSERFVDLPIVNNSVTGGLGNNLKPGRFVCHLYSGMELFPLDQDGTSDPFVVVSYLQASNRSTLKNDTLNPLYYENIVLDTLVFGPEQSPPIIINVFDQDKLSKDFLGSLFLDAKEAYDNRSLSYNGRPNKPQWYSIKNGQIESGKLLLAFSIYEPGYNESIPKSIQVNIKKYRVDLFLLALRDLKSTGVFSVKKPYLEIEFEALNIYSNIKGPTEKNIKTEPLNSGNSITLKKTAVANLYLPEDPMLWSPVSVKVRDYIAGGIYEPLLGYFSIDLAKSYTKSQSVIKRARAQEQAQEGVVGLQSRRNIGPRMMTWMTQNFGNARKSREELVKVHPGVLKLFSTFIIKNLNYNWSIMNERTKLNKIRGTNNKLDPASIILFPGYREREPGVFVDDFAETLKNNPEYRVVGFDTPDQRGSKSFERRNRHYRYILDQSYQKYYQRTHGHKLGMFEEIPIRRGKKMVGNNLMTQVLRKFTTEDTYTGIYKGSCFIREAPDDNQTSQTQEVKLAERQREEFIKNFINSAQVYVFVYILEARNLPAKDTFSPSDSYLVCKVGNQQQDSKARRIDDDSNPNYNEKFKFLCTLPEDAILNIQVWDYDDVVRDDMIGSVQIDLENRFNMNRNNISANNPIECHQIRSATSRLSQGQLKLWIDLVPVSKIDLYKQFKIEAQPKERYEVRVIVWGCEGMPNKDFEDMNDLYIECNFGKDKQVTDTHFRTSTGQGSFNWRMIFPVQMPSSNHMLTFKVFDKDLLSPDDYISSGSFGIDKYLSQCFENQKGDYLYLGDEDLAQDTEVSFSSPKIIEGKSQYNRFKVKMFNRRKGGYVANQEGEIEISVQILTKKQSQLRPAGLGRAAPNQNPFLPEPKGRAMFSWNPFKMAGMLCGKKFKYEILCVLTLVILALVVYNVGYSTFGAWLALLTK